MAINERSRHEMYLKLEQVLGAREANTLMEHLPPVGWSDVATKRDLDQLAAVTKRDLDQLAAVTKRDLDHSVAIINGTVSQLAATVDYVAEVMRRDLEATKHELIAMFRGEIAAAITSQTRTLALMIVGALFSTAGLAFAAARLV